MKMTGLTGLGLMTLLLPLAAQKQDNKPAENGDRAAQEYSQTLEATAVAQEVQEVKKQDSLRRLIHELDTGSTSDRSSPAFRAYSSLRSLGSLMVPALLAELDDMGPFGLMNASKLLTSYPDEGLGTLVERYLKDPSPARQEMASGLLSRLARNTRRKLYPLALASKRDKVRLAGLYSMMDLGIERDLVMKEIGRVYKEARTPTKISLINLVAGPELSKSAKGKAFLQAAMTDPDAGVRPTALHVFVEAATEQEEDQALALMAKLHKTDREHFLYGVLDERKKWPRVLLAALEFEDLQGRVPRVLDNLGIRLSGEQIETLLGSQDRNVVSFALRRLSARGELVPGMDGLLDLLDDPNDQIRRSARVLLVDHGSLLLLESGRFADLYRLGLALTLHVGVVERAPSGHWSKELFMLWRAMEQYEAASYRSTEAPGKARIGTLLVKTIEARDWPLVEEFLRDAFADPKFKKPLNTGRIQMNRADLVSMLLEAGFFSRDRQAKALLLTPVTTDKIAMAIFVQVAESLSEGEARPELEAALFQLLAQVAEKSKGKEQAVKRHAYPRGKLLNFIFSLIAQLPSSKRDAELMTLVKSSDSEVAIGASRALLARSKDRIAVFQAMLATPHSTRMIRLFLDDAVLTADPKLRALVSQQLQGDLIHHLSENDRLESFLRNLPLEERQQLLRILLQKNQKGLAVHTTRALLRAMGELADESTLASLAPYLRHPEVSVRRSAVDSIGLTFSPKAAPLLIEALKDVDGDNAQNANAYLQRIDEYLQEKEKWEGRFSERKPSTPGPAGPGKTKK